MTYSIKDVQKRYGVGEHTVYGWIHRGELRAFSVARRPGGKPKYRVTQEALDEFEASRAAATTPPPKATRRKKPTDTIEFYKEG